MARIARATVAVVTGEEVRDFRKEGIPLGTRGTVSAMAAAWKSLFVEGEAGTRLGMGEEGDEGRQRTWKSLDQHTQDVRRIAQSVRTRTPEQLITMKRGGGESHCPRDASYKDGTLQVDLMGMDGVIGVQETEEGWLALVEPRVTMQTLVPPLVPLLPAPPALSLLFSWLLPAPTSQLFPPSSFLPPSCSQLNSCLVFLAAEISCKVRATLPYGLMPPVVPE
eukprot:508951-Hanusia_phi.AAC.2